MKKIQKVFGVFFLLFALCFSVNGQTEVQTIEISSIPFSCGQYNELLEGTITVRNMIHKNKAGEPKWMKTIVNGNNLTIDGVGRYSVNGIYKTENLSSKKEVKVTFRMNVAGGSSGNYKLMMTMDYHPKTGELRYLQNRMVCD